MPLQYISDHAGNHTAVIIPIMEWELLTCKYEDLQQLEQPKKYMPDKKFSNFAGSMPAYIANAFTKAAVSEASVTTNISPTKLKPPQMRRFLSVTFAEAMQLNTEQSPKEQGTF